MKYTLHIISILVTLGFSTDYKTVLIKYNTMNELNQLAKYGIDLDHHRTPTEVHAYATTNQLNLIKSMGFDAYEIPNHAHDYFMQLKEETKNSNNPLRAYHDYNELTLFMQNIANQYPNITQLESIGQSVQGRELWVMQISDNPGFNEAEPEFKYIANMHGDETPGREFSLYFIELLCESYGFDSRLTNLVDNTDIYIMPTMNPDGFELGQRYNANGVDLNRDFPDQFDDPNNTVNGREPETRAVMEWSAEHNFVLSANMHSGALVVNYPFDGPQTGSYSACPDDDLFVQVALVYSDSHPNMEQGGFNNGITNGAQWYALSGGMQDWNYVWEENFEVTLEQHQTKFPNSNQLNSLWNQHREPMIAYVEEIHKGIRGFVLDSETQEPLDATIYIQGINHNVSTDSDNGDYYRLLTPGTYTITAESYGYFGSSQTVTVTSGNATNLDFNLQAMPQEPYLQYESSNSGIISAGDTVDLDITINNIGIGTATNVSGIISTNSPYITITNNYSTFNNISAPATSQNQTPYQFSISSLCPNNELIEFELELSSNQGAWNSSFSIVVGLYADSFESDFNNLDWQFSSIPWEIGADSFDGNSSAQSGNINDNQSSTMAITLDVSSDGNISFYKKVSSEQSYDFLNFYINGDLQESWSGEQDWSLSSFPVSTGFHTFTWSFDKDGSVSDGSDCGWIDYVIFPPAVNENPDIILGDVNFDGVINVLDIISLITYVLLTESPGSNEFLASDINQDGSLDVLDVVLTVNIILNQ